MESEREREKERKPIKACVRVRKRASFRIKNVRSPMASRLDLGIKRASEERHKRESEHYIVIYISQTNKQKNGWTSDVTFIRASSNTILDVKRGQRISLDEDGGEGGSASFEIRASIGPRCAMHEQATLRTKCRIFGIVFASSWRERAPLRTLLLLSDDIT